MRAWSMDRLAAANLLSALNIEPTEDNLVQAMRHFADHRQYAINWAADRVHGTMVDRLEVEARDDLNRHGDAWNEGFRFAEHRVRATRPRDLLDLAPDRPLSRGQILRKLMRRARQAAPSDRR